MTSDRLSSPDIRALPAADVALFLDFDGTLVDIAPSPDEVLVTDRLRATLERLENALAGAVAIVSGRDLDDLDGHLRPLALASAGGHGGTIRRHGGAVHALEDAPARVEDLVARARAFCERYPGLLCEAKAGGVAIHYRARPELGAACLKFAESLVEGAPSFEVMPGKMVVEIKPAGADKGKAVAALMAEPPFHGRLPVFIGDDVTDEAAFAEINRRRGVSVKVGGGPTIARHRMAGTGDLADWLDALAAAAEDGAVP